MAKSEELKARVRILIAQPMEWIELFEMEIEELMGRVRGVAIAESMKVTWLGREDSLIFIIEWCEDEKAEQLE